MDNINVMLISNKSSGKLKAFINEDGNMEYIITDMVPEDVQAIESFLTTKREFRIPQSPAIDDDKIIKALPTENGSYFNLALCNLMNETGIKVIWQKEAT